MSKGMNRRDFLKWTGVAAAVMTTVGTGKVYANNTANYWIYGFNEDLGEETLVRKAVGIAVNRMQEIGVRRNAYDVATKASISGEVMDNSNLTDSEENRWNLLWHQLHWLSQPNGDDDTEPAFPNIHIRAKYDDEGKWLGKANLDLVKVRSEDGEIKQSGEFDVTLNRYYLGAPGVYSDPEEWASTLVHEMLHNLGHLHPKGDDALSDQFQINAMNNAVLCDGYFKDPVHSWHSASHLCGGRL